MDIVVYDDLCSAALASEPAASIYPIEMVAATIEVKAMLNADSLKEACNAVRTIRLMAQHRVEAFDENVVKGAGVVVREGRRPVASDAPPPRAFIVAFDAVWASEVSMQQALSEAAAASDAHLHGVVVLSRDWVFGQEAYAVAPGTIHARTGSALLRFVRGFVASVHSAPTYRVPVGVYLSDQNPRGDHPAGNATGPEKSPTAKGHA
jgi:hypothetical protein